MDYLGIFLLMFGIFHLIISVICLSFTPYEIYCEVRKEKGERSAIKELILIIGFCLIPFFNFVIIGGIINSWISNDPTSPKNIANPDFTPPPKKEKKYKGIKNRFDILDI